jgi:hypothetical protein
VQPAGFAEGAAGFTGVADERGDRLAAREQAADDFAADAGGADHRGGHRISLVRARWPTRPGGGPPAGGGPGGRDRTAALSLGRAPMPSSRLDRGESFPDEVMIVMRRTALANAHVACLHTALARPGPSLNVTASDPGTMLPVMRWDAPLEFHLAPMFLAGTFDARDVATYGGRPPHDDYRLQRPVIAVATLDESFRLLSELLGSDSSDPLLALADLLTRSAAAFGRYDVSVSLVLAWAMIETMINDLWERFIDQTEARAGLAGFSVAPMPPFPEATLRASCG